LASLKGRLRNIRLLLWYRNLLDFGRGRESMWSEGIGADRN